MSGIFESLEIIEQNFSGTGFILAKYIPAFEQHMLSKGKYKPGTLRETIYELYRFDRFLSKEYPKLEHVKQINEEHIKQYIDFCTTKLENKNKTVNKKLKAIRRLLDYLTLHKGELKHNPAWKVSYLKQEKELRPRHIPVEDLKKIINEFYKKDNGIRDVCIIKFLVLTGLLISEVFQLKVEHVDLDSNVFFVRRRGKNGKEKSYTFAIPKSLKKDLTAYMEWRAFLAAYEHSGALFLSNSGQPYSIRAFQQNFKKVVLELDLNKGYSPRHLRATFSYNMTKSVDKETLKKILNQEKVEHYYIEVAKDPLLASV
ncbi:MAG: tyrosine-type recombinase/integrase [Thermosipho sp. (in: Bacteria)]|nr:tyrosine-type recombinase/integrase [Thermosipho sp. (in: thermotogales)]